MQKEKNRLTGMLQNMKIRITQYFQTMKERRLLRTRQERKKQLLQLCLTAMFTALTTVVTMFIQIPNPATGGYVNIGDCVVLIGGTILGPIPGLFAGGLGSAIADLATGYAHWALPTFIIKGLEGFLCGLTTYFIFRHTKKRSVKLTFTAIASLMCAAIMMVGYFFANIALGGMGKAIESLIPNTIQAVVSFAINIVIVAALIKTPVFEGYLQDALLRKKGKSNVSEEDIEYVTDNAEIEIGGLQSANGVCEIVCDTICDKADKKIDNVSENIGDSHVKERANGGA